MTEHAWVPATIGGEQCFACGAFRQHHDHDPTVYYDRIGGNELDGCPPCTPFEPDPFAKLYATLPECDEPLPDGSECTRKATVHDGDFNSMLCDEHRQTFYLDPPDLPWSHIVREQEACK